MNQDYLFLHNIMKLYWFLQILIIQTGYNLFCTSIAPTYCNLQISYFYVILPLVEYTNATSQSVCPFPPGLGGGMGKFGHIWAKVGKGGQVLMSLTDRAGMGDMASG